MKVAVFDTHKFERPVFEKFNGDFRYDITYFESRLTLETAALADGFKVVCSFVNDRLSKEVLARLKERGVELIALRSAGFNHVDIAEAKKLGIRVVRVPAYSPHAVGEHAVCLMLALNRKIHRAYGRVKEHNFSLDGLVGFDFNGKTVGVVGTGKIGGVVAMIMHGFGCKILAYDVVPNEHLQQKAGAEYVSLEELFQRSDVISLHVPLTPETRHLVDERSLSLTKEGVMIINTGRGALIDTSALISALKSGQVGSAGLDVYEEEENVFFQDLSEVVLQDDVLARLLTFPNVLITSHQGFLTKEALENIVLTTFRNIKAYQNGLPLENQVKAG
ncbi:MAG: 2-hydroxyacid dehydrogenase [Bdellovibrionia bacterium]